MNCPICGFEFAYQGLAAVNCLNVECLHFDQVYVTRDFLPGLRSTAASAAAGCSKSFEDIGKTWGVLARRTSSLLRKITFPDSQDLSNKEFREAEAAYCYWRDLEQEVLDIWTSVEDPHSNSCET